MAGSLSDYAENKVLDHITGKTAFTMPTIYVGLKTADPTDDNSGGTEPTAGTGGYARVTTDGDSWDTAASGATANAKKLTFATSTTAWSTGATELTHFILMDALTGGNMIGNGDLDDAEAVGAATIILEYAIGALDFTLT